MALTPRRCILLAAVLGLAACDSSDVSPIADLTLRVETQLAHGVSCDVIIYGPGRTLTDDSYTLDGYAVEGGPSSRTWRAGRLGCRITVPGNIDPFLVTISQGSRVLATQRVSWYETGTVISADAR